jgi:protein-disulfide isomerase
MRLRVLTAASCAALLSGSIAQAEPLFDAAERAALGAEIRALLLAEPEIAARALTPPSAFEEAVSADMERLTRLAPQLFDPAQAGFGAADAALRIAFFTADDCADCARAEADLRALAASHDLRVSVFSMADAAARDLAARLELTETPAYVLPDMMLQGHIPHVILERYLAR